MDMGALASFGPGIRAVQGLQFGVLVGLRVRGGLHFRFGVM